MYDAFISYSRGDEKFASKLERALERYRIPKSFQRTRRRFEVFRDVQDAGIGELTEILRGALDESDFLIVVCSPHSRLSEYVDLEIDYFARRAGESRIIPVLVSGRPNGEVAADDTVQDQAFPQALFQVFDEPLAADFRLRDGEKRGPRKARLREAKFQVVAKLLRTRKTEELVGREKRRQRLLHWGLMAVTAVGLCFGVWTYYDSIPKPGIVNGIPRDAEWAPRARERLDALKAALRSQVPDRRDPGRLLVSTWSLNDFGQARLKSGGPNQESLTYMAEIISHFDIVALQQLRGGDADFEPLFERLRDLLGRHWHSAVTGVVEGRAGNQERLGFVWDSRKLRFGQFTDEIVLPPELLQTLDLEQQLARTPFLAGFHFGDRRLVFCTVHIYFGGSSREKLERRRNEVKAVLRYLARAQDHDRLWADTVILLGDLQVVNEQDPSLEAIREEGFILPAGLEALPSNLTQTRPYDQLTLRWPANGATLSILDGGVFNFFEHVYREEDQTAYEEEWQGSFDGAAADRGKHKAYRRWKSYRMSDHLPKWLLLESIEPD